MNCVGARSKKILKLVTLSLLPTQHSPIIVASMGRSGSTLIWDALRYGMANSRFPWMGKNGVRLVTETAWDLSTIRFKPGVVYKTHGLAHELPSNCSAKVVFIFGSATEAALSVLACRSKYGDHWIKEHFVHLRAKGHIGDLGDRDVLRFGEQIDGWIGKTGIERLILHYDALWEHERTLSEFAGVNVKLRPRRPRVSTEAVDSKTRAFFAQTYSALDERIRLLPTCQLLK